MFDQTPSNLEELIDFTEQEYSQTQREIKEITMLVEQSQNEVERLTSRNAAVSNRLLQLEQNFDTVPRADIKAAYEAMSDAKQRLFTMRGQLEKLQSDRAGLERYATLLEQIHTVLDSSPSTILAAGGDSPQRPSNASAQMMVTRIIDAQEGERLRLSRAIHDGPAQSLTNFILQAEIVQRLFDSDLERARVELANLKTAATTTFQLVRDFISELRPMMLDDLGMVPTMRRYVSNFGDKSDIAVSLSVLGEERRMESHREVLAFRGLQELLINAQRHSQATSIRVTLDIDEERCRVSVEDNGRGFDANAVFAGRTEQKTVGLPSLYERVELLGGQLQIDSAVGQGTTAVMEIPNG